MVPGQDYEDTLQDNQLYDRDSSYKAPSANYAAPDTSYEAPSYSSYEASEILADFTCMGVIYLCSVQAPKYEPNYTPSYEGYSGG